MGRRTESQDRGKIDDYDNADRRVMKRWITRRRE